MTTSINNIRAHYPGVTIADGAIVPRGCRIDPGCEIGPEVNIRPGIIMFPRVRIWGPVKIGYDVHICEDVTIIGPVEIKGDVFIAKGCKIGVTPITGCDKATVILEGTQIGKFTEVHGGITIGHHVRIKAETVLQGDVPDNGLVSRSPAVLMGFVCPQCGTQLRSVRRMGLLILCQCPVCQSDIFRMRSTDYQRLRRVLLPGHQMGEKVRLDGEIHKWREEVELE